jgi:trans-2,3-dihydro-3-hydroxyanthranilate isomerase
VIVQTVVFAEREGGGNPCPVVLDADDWPTSRMQAAAASFGHETAFVLDDGAGGVRLRYFVPRHEMEMCVHATIAAAVVLVRRGREIRSVLTPLGRLGVEVDAAAGTAVVDQFPPTFGAPVEDAAALLAALGVPADAVAGPVQAVSVSRAKAMIPLVDEGLVDGLAPGIPALWDACRELSVTGAYPFARTRGGFAARQFPVDAGYPEDPATGVAACALGAYLSQGAADGWHRYEIAQGRAMGRPSLIFAEALVEGGTVTATRVGGAMRELP